MILAGVWSLLDDHSSVLCSSHDMFCYDVDWALNYYLRPLFDIARENTAAFRSVSSNQAETNCEMLGQSASSKFHHSISNCRLRLQSVTSGLPLPIRTGAAVRPRGSFGS